MVVTAWLIVDIDVVHIARASGKQSGVQDGRIERTHDGVPDSDHGTDRARRQRQPDPLRFLTDFRDEIRAVVKGVNIAGMDNTDRVRQVAQPTVDELFSLMKPPSTD